MTEHRALGSAGGAAGIENPREVFGATVHDRAGFARRQVSPFLFAEHDEAGFSRQESGKRTGNVHRRDAKACAAIGGDIGEFARVQLGICRDCDKARAPDREENGEIFGVVGHRRERRGRQAASRAVSPSTKRAGPPVRHKRHSCRGGDRRSRPRAARESFAKRWREDGRGSRVSLFRAYARSRMVMATAASSMPRRPPPFSASAMRASVTCREPASPRS